MKHVAVQITIPYVLQGTTLPSLSVVLRHQAGIFVGLPSQVFGSPSPHFQLSKFRWLSAYLIMSTYVNMLLTPGTLGFGLACMFEEVSGLVSDFSWSRYCPALLYIAGLPVQRARGLEWEGEDG